MLEVSPPFGVSVTAPPSALLSSDDFGTGDKSYTQNGFAWLGNGVNSAVVADATSPSGFALRLRVPVMNATTEEAWTEQRFTFGATPRPDVTLCEEVVIPSNYQHPNGPISAIIPPAGASDNNKGCRVWTGDETDGQDGYVDYYIKGAWSFFPLATPGNGSRLGTEWGSDVFQEGVGQNGTPLLNFITEADRGTKVKIITRIKTDTLGTINSSMETTGGDGAIQVWIVRPGNIITQVANLTTLRWRSVDGIAEIAGFRKGYLRGYLNQAAPVQMDWMFHRFAIATGPSGPQAFGVP